MGVTSILRAGSTVLPSDGRIELIMGPMFSGKTSELMRRIKREIHARRSCFVVKYAKDVRYDKDAVASHDQLTLKAQAAVGKLADVGEQWKAFDVVAVDEGQFFPDLVQFCNSAADAGKVVLVSALDADYLRRPFGQICDLVPFCESIDKLTAVCMMCHCRQASFTRRTVDSQEQELIGGADMYIATCRQCYNEPCAPSREELQQVHDAIQRVEEDCLGISMIKAKALSRTKPVAEQHSDEDAARSSSSSQQAPSSSARLSAAHVKDDVGANADSPQRKLRRYETDS